MTKDTRTCLACGVGLEPDGEGRLPIQCPHCGEILILDDEEELREALPPEASDELEGAKIRQVVVARRAMVRMRGYCLVGTAACVAIALQLFWRTIEMASAPMIAAGYAAGGVLLLLVAGELWRRARNLSEQIKATALKDPTTPPDFSALSDGSQHARDLGRLGDRPPPPEPPMVEPPAPEPDH